MYCFCTFGIDEQELNFDLKIKVTPAKQVKH